MRVEVNDIPKLYKNELNDYFNDLQINKNNFFTDVSNFTFHMKWDNQLIAMMH